MSTMREIARIARVSVATVSRVVNNDQTYRMKAQTRDRVWKAIADTGYKVPPPRVDTPNSKRAKQKSIGCVLSIVKEKYRDPYFMSVLAGIEKRFARYGYTLDFLRTKTELREPSILSDIIERPPAGLILMDTLDSNLYRHLLDHIPNCVGIDTQHNDIDNVGYDQLGTAKNAVDFLIARGHRDIAFIGGDPNTQFFNNGRYDGYCLAMQAAGLKVHENWVHNCRWDELACIEQVRGMMALSPRPTAIFAASDLMAMAALSALYSMGFSVPAQVAVIGISNIELSRFSSPPLTTYEVPAFEIGLLAVDLLEERLRENFPLPKRVLLPTRQILRESV